jgi:hypothetical protein
MLVVLTVVCNECRAIPYHVHTCLQLPQTPINRLYATLLPSSPCATSPTWCCPPVLAAAPSEDESSLQCSRLPAPPSNGMLWPSSRHLQPSLLCAAFFVLPSCGSGAANVPSLLMQLPSSSRPFAIKQSYVVAGYLRTRHCLCVSIGKPWQRLRPHRCVPSVAAPLPSSCPHQAAVYRHHAHVATSSVSLVANPAGAAHCSPLLSSHLPPRPPPSGCVPCLGHQTCRPHILPLRSHLRADFCGTSCKEEG